VDERQVIEQRIATLDALLDTPGGPLGPAAGDLGDRLRQGWQDERRLLRRILVDASSGHVTSTVAVWRARTEAFMRQANGASPGWRDKDGHYWDAGEVLRLLDDIEERLRGWLGTGGTDGPADGGRAQS
jgi:hypothetical protein